MGADAVEHSRREVQRPFVEALQDGLRDLGYVDGHNIAIEYRSDDGRPERLPLLAAELVRLKVDVLVAPTNPRAMAARNATATIPIVMLIRADQVIDP